MFYNNKRVKNQLKILHANVQGMRNKFQEIKHLTQKYHPDIAVLNETKINLTKEKFNILGYDKIFERKANHLGTAIYIKRGVRWCQIKLIETIDDDERNIEGCALRIFTNHTTGEYITLKGIYVPIPNQADCADEFEQLLREDSAIVIGDMNLCMTAHGHTQNRGLGILLRNTQYNNRTQ